MTSSPLVRADDPAELLALVPYLVGFHPAESLVVLALADTRVVLTARVDLVAERMFDAPHVAAIAQDAGADRLVLVAYAADAILAADLVDLFVGLVPRSIELDEAWRVDDGRFWCLVPSCGCADGEPHDPSTTTTAAQAVLAGMRVAASRDILEDAVRAPSGERLEAVERAYDEVGPQVADLTDEQRRDRLALALEQFLAAPRQLTVAECVELSMLVRLAQVRDVATTRIRREDAERHLDLWGQVARSSADPFSVAAVTLAGLAAWVSGDGALMNVCIERAERSDPDFALLRILCDISDGGVPPSRWEALCAGMREAA